ncbi:unnamed protein product [Trichogramma brassicae]|uniref:Uncharacterized protein n=1 Tax=Trichogramma brassicae TaxID=86971 RepID=A0A6H5IAH9_9HYME|nr:unnamed protein product [Trichogramma brassicae]
MLHEGLRELHRVHDVTRAVSPQRLLAARNLIAQLSRRLVRWWGYKTSSSSAARLISFMTSEVSAAAVVHRLSAKIVTVYWPFISRNCFLFQESPHSILCEPDTSFNIILRIVMHSEDIINIPRDCLIIDRSKIRREREKSRKSTEKFEFSENEKWGLYFDGKIDQTYMMEKDKLSETHHRRKIAEDHIALIKEPGSKYLAYAAPKSGKAEEVCETLIDKLIEYKAPLEQLEFIGSDGTNVNTGSKGRYHSVCNIT